MALYKINLTAAEIIDNCVNIDRFYCNIDWNNVCVIGIITYIAL